MTDAIENLEGGLPRAGHREEDGPRGPVTLGSDDYRYVVSGENWGRLPDDWRYNEATAVAVDRHDRVYVFNRGTNPMVVLDPSGTVVDAWTWEQGQFSKPHGIAIGPDGSVYCVDNGDSTVRKFSADGRLLLTLGDPNNPAPPMSNRPFCHPTHVAVDHESGDLYVTDGYRNAAVHKFSAEGKHLFSWGGSGTDEGQFNIVHNVQVGRHGWVFVADRENQRIQVFSSQGRYETQWVNLARAACLGIDTSGERDIVYVGEYFSGIASNDIATNIGPRVSVMTADGTVLSRVGTEPYGSQAGRFFSPHGIGIDSKGDVYVAEVAHSDYGLVWRVKDELRSLQKLVRSDKPSAN
jgi:DNA-binding beta-propeller fold protein YncE